MPILIQPPKRSGCNQELVYTVDEHLDEHFGTGAPQGARMCCSLHTNESTIRTTVKMHTLFSEDADVQRYKSTIHDVIKQYDNNDPIFDPRIC